MSNRPQGASRRTASQRPTREIAQVGEDTQAAHHDRSDSFLELGVPASLVQVLQDAGITSPFPVQQATLPATLAGKDVLGRGRTGSGKTLAFSLPLVVRLAGTRSKALEPRGLVLAPTRELAAQIGVVLAPLAAACGLTSTTIFGGVPAGPQCKAMRAGVDIIIACPGRLEDLISNKHVRLTSIEVTVLDEADHMADLGFMPVVRRLLDMTPAGQRMLFSATLDSGVDQLVKRYLNNPVVRSVDSDVAPVAPADHQILHISVDQRLEVLKELIAGSERSIVFTRTKYRAKTLTRQLTNAGVKAVELHGNLAQTKRIANLAAFAAGRANVLIATDIAARGIHVDDVSLVIHADPPTEHKAYLHRSGRTARAGQAGRVITLMTDEQRPAVAKLVKAAGLSPEITQYHANTPNGKRARGNSPTQHKAAKIASEPGVEPMAATSTGGWISIPA